MKKALVVGINGYGFPNDLPSCTRDAEMFGNILEAVYRFDHVRVLKDGEATRDGVDRALEGLCQSATANDRLVFFFSGRADREYDRADRHVAHPEPKLPGTPRPVHATRGVR